MTLEQMLDDLRRKESAEYSPLVSTLTQEDQIQVQSETLEVRHELHFDNNLARAHLEYTGRL
jgi:hypothetical protein